MKLYVSKTKENAYRTVSLAISKAKEGDVIFIEKGIYKERIELTTPNVSIIGESSEETVITDDYYAFMTMEDGSKRGTFRSYTAFIDAHDVYVENLTFENSAGSGKEFGQAIALYAEGEHLHFKNCRFLGHQDTLFTGPLPPMEYEHSGFIGPKERAPRINGRQWYENCYIEGDVDFIFGSATSIFTDCTICSLNRDMEPNGYVTAPSTPKGQEYGYVFLNCDFVNKECRDKSVYLSRPWREYAKCVFINCRMGEHIKDEGYHDWKKEVAHETTFYAEYPYKMGRVDWSFAIKEEELGHYSLERVYMS